MFDLMEVLASSMDNEVNAKIRWAYVYTPEMGNEATGADFDWPAYIRAVQGHEDVDTTLFDRYEITEKLRSTSITWA